MTEPEQKEIRKKPSHWVRHVLIFFSGFLILLFWGFFFGFIYFGERLLRKYLQEKIHTASHGLYNIDFGSMHLNILNGNITVQDFELFPDTVKYKQLKSEGKIKSALYRISFSSLSINRLHLLLAYRHRRLVARELKLVKPNILILALPDSSRVRKNRFNLIYEDIYPLVKQTFTDFHVDSVKVEHGFMLSGGLGKQRQLNRGEYEFSACLRDLSINPFSYYNKDRVFYSTDLDLVIYNFEYSLADSLYFIRAAEVGFSLTRSRLYGKNLSLKPNFQKKHLHQVHRGDFYQLNLPSFSIAGINLYQALTDRKVQVRKVELENFSLHVFRNKAETGDISTVKKKKKKLVIADLFTIISGELNAVGIDSFLLKKASFEYYPKLTGSNPELRIAEVNLDLSGFYLDSAANRNKEKIFYANEIQLELNEFSMQLRDEIHALNAGRIWFSTNQNKIEVRDAIITPDQVKNKLMGSRKKNTVSFFLPGMVFSGINLKQVFNHRVLDFTRLEILEPDLKFIQFHKSKKIDPRFRRAEDFFDEQNNDVVYELLKKYINLIRGKEIRIDRGYFEFDHNQDGVNKKIVSAGFDLQMIDLLIDSVHGMNQQGYFYSQDFNLDVKNLNYLSPDSLSHFQAERIRVITADSLIAIQNLKYVKSADPLSLESLHLKSKNRSVDFFLKSLVLTGLNHKKLFLEKILKAREIMCDKPSLRVKTEASPTGPDMLSGPIEEDQYDKILTFEVSRLNVRQGSFSYDGNEDKKASYFSLKDIDFTLLNAFIHIPEKGENNGIIRFDSLQLSVLPFHAVISDSTYALECNSLKVHSYPVNITVEGLKLIPLKPFRRDDPASMRITANIPLLNISGFYFDKAIFNKQWIIEKITADRPEVFLEIRPEKKASHALQLPPMMTCLQVPSFLISGMNFRAKIHRSEKVNTFELKGINARILNFVLDSVTQAFPEKVPLFNAGDISFSAKGISMITNDSLYIIGFTGFGGSSGNNTAWLDSLTILPRFSKESFSIKTGHQTDRLEIRIPTIKLEQVNYRMLINDTVLHAGLLRIQDFSIEDYRDKRVTFPIWQRPPMPARALKRIKFPVIIDTIKAIHGIAAYEEQTGAEPGRIFFDSLNLTLTNFTNRPEERTVMDVHTTSRLMGKGQVNARYQFLLDHPRDSFTFSARMGPLDLRELNPMISKLMPVSIRSGVAEKTEILYFSANDSLSRGTLNIYFRNLGISLDPTREDLLHKVQKKLETTVANWIVGDNNPDDEGKFRQGIICYDRDKSKGFFNFIWKSTLSGIKSSAGFNSKQQREIRRSEKKRKSKSASGK